MSLSAVNALPYLPCCCVQECDEAGKERSKVHNYSYRELLCMHVYYVTPLVCVMLVAEWLMLDVF